MDPSNKICKNEFSCSPLCIIVLGMAGSGKSSFVQKLAQVSYQHFKPYVINLDPACHETLYHSNMDIRDTVNYKEVMEQYKLGPNGGIVTSLNLFATQFDKVVEIIKRAGEQGHKWCIIDTPGQIEVFTWSASGTIITEALATGFPTVVVYVMDVVRSLNPTTFMSNMLYACSILYKARLPLIVALNKIDVHDHDFALEWMHDFEAFQQALENENAYVGNLTRTMSLTLDEFYKDLNACGISSTTGVGFDKMCKLILNGSKEYERDYQMEYNKLRIKLFESRNEKLKKSLNKIVGSHGDGSEVNFSSSIEKNFTKCNITDVHPGNNSSDEEQEYEENPIRFADDELEEQNFKQFLPKNEN